MRQAPSLVPANLRLARPLHRLNIRLNGRPTMSSQFQYLIRGLWRFSVVPPLSLSAVAKLALDSNPAGDCVWVFFQSGSVHALPPPAANPVSACLLLFPGWLLCGSYTRFSVWGYVDRVRNVLPWLFGDDAF